MHIIYICFVQMSSFSFELHKKPSRFIIINGINCAVLFTFKTVPSGKNHMVRMEEKEYEKTRFFKRNKGIFILV